jgi:hypothetical protein
MSRLLEMVEEKAHQRAITITTYKAGVGKAVIEGKLVDHRLMENYLLTGEKILAGDIHNMIVRLLIDTTSLMIEDVEVELVKVPRPECTELYNSLSVIKGLRISKGFTQKIKSLLGGIKSCSHLRELAEAMGPAIIQGVFSIRASNAAGLRALINDPHMKKAFSDSIANSCYVWREDGPEFKKVFGNNNRQGEA